MVDTKRNLCDTCLFTVPECNAVMADIKFGDGVGGDNVIECSFYEKYSPSERVLKGQGNE